MSGRGVGLLLDVLRDIAVCPTWNLCMAVNGSTRCSHYLSTQPPSETPAATLPAKILTIRCPSQSPMRVQWRLLMLPHLDWTDITTALNPSATTTMARGLPLPWITFLIGWLIPQRASCYSKWKQIESLVKSHYHNHFTSSFISIFVYGQHSITKQWTLVNTSISVHENIQL